MKTRFRTLVAAFALAAATFAGAAHAAYPERPVRVVVPFAAGSGTDILTRLVTSHMAKSLGTSFVVDNKPGAQGQIAAETAARAEPDGYTLMVTTNSAHSATPFLMKKVGYDPVKDFTPITQFNRFLFVLVVDPRLPIHNVQQLLDYARANPTSYGFGNSTGEVAGAHFTRTARLKSNAVPYKSTPPAMNDIISQQIQYMFVDWAASNGMVKADRLRVIGVQSDQRSRLLPDLPAVGETVPGFDFQAWGGLVGPAGMPKDVVTKLNAAAIEAIGSAEVQERMLAMGLEPATSTPEAFAIFIKQQLDIWGRKIRESGIEAQ